MAILTRVRSLKPAIVQDTTVAQNAEDGRYWYFSQHYVYAYLMERIYQFQCHFKFIQQCHSASQGQVDIKHN